MPSDSLLFGKILTYQSDKYPKYEYGLGFNHLVS